MSKQATNTETVLLPESDLIPLALIAVEIGETVGWVAARFGESVVTDDVGMRAISAAEARAFFAERAEWQAQFEEEQARRWSAVEDRLPVGVPAVEGMSAFETMAASPDYQSIQDEFGMPRPNFIVEELEQGRRLAEAQEKEQLAEQAKRALR